MLTSTVPILLGMICALGFSPAQDVGNSVSVQTFAQVRPNSNRPLEWIPQRGRTDCGVAALTMALRWLGLDVFFEQLEAITPVGLAGVSLGALARTATASGVPASAVRLGSDQLSHARLPAVAHLVGDHYVVVSELRGDTVVVADPAEGVRPDSVQSFRRRWSGHLLVFGIPTVV